MPHIEAASHAFSHPYVWIDNDEDYIPLYTRRNLALQESVDYPEIDLEREIAGSTAYIEENLLPEGKNVEVMLWSGKLPSRSRGATHHPAPWSREHERGQYRDFS